MDVLGDFINGAFHLPPSEPQSQPLRSRNPARDGAIVFESAWSAERMSAACDAAAEAARAWSAAGREQRWQALVRFREALQRRGGALADAIVAETGKLRSEAVGEARALVSRFDLVRAQAERDMQEGRLPGHPHEQQRFQALGVVGVIGPFNYPLHLCHAHVVPALLMGNAVVIKPSEVAPLAAQRYAEAALEAGLPAGVFNLVHGGPAAGVALAGHPAVRGLCFTGSYEVGRKLTAQSVDRPELLLALEMGGKNTAVVFDDASLRQAAHEIVLGGYLSAGQRCTASDRVLVQRRLLKPLLAALQPLVAALRIGDPENPASFAGPLSTEGGRERFERALSQACAAGAEPVIAGGRIDGGFFVRPSLHLVPEGVHHIAGYTDTELFGPDLGVEVFDDDEEAAAIVARSPYGFANAVFTGSDERFERFCAATMAGIVNRNRSTNLASPRLPFGGVGRSGNYRPAGAYALRNVVLPTAVQDNVLGAVHPHPMLAAHLPAPDLDLLAAQHAAEEEAEAQRSLLDMPRPQGPRRPSGGRLPQSDAWLLRLYAGERVVREKKPAVFDHLRSHGGWFVSVDDEPLSVLDGMSQTATLAGGFADDTVVRGYTEGAFAGTLLQTADTSAREHQSARAFADFLRAQVPGLPHVTYANSGAEANEKALALCLLAAQRRGSQARKVLAFEGGFHGRTLLALHATYNPAKRGPFEIAGYEASFAPFPVWRTPHQDQPAAPSGFYAAAAAGDADALESQLRQDERDPLLAEEVRALVAVHAALASGEYFACIVEPMQCEGGDRYASNRFFRALRLLTRRQGVALIMDEVQTGFGLGGSFAWHTTLDLIDSRGEPDVPDAVTFAKRAQAGVVMSVVDDPEPTGTQPASLVRGRLHGEVAAQAAAEGDAERVAAHVRPHLFALAEAYPHLVSEPRCRGYAIAFDLPSPGHLAAYLGQRFWRGAIVYGAGTRTVRYRLSTAFGTRELDMLVTSMRRSLSWLDAHPHASPPAWEDPARPPRANSEDLRVRVRVRAIDADQGKAVLDALCEMEAEIYEPARQTPRAELEEAIVHPDGVSLLAEVQSSENQDDDDWQLAGFALSIPLEAVADTPGPDRDPMRGRDNTLYSVSITVARAFQSRGIGRQLKAGQLREAATREATGGGPRYRYLTGRNRSGHTASMTHLNRAFGAHVVCTLRGQYNDPEGEAVYYRIPIGPLQPNIAGPGRATPSAGDAAAVTESASSDTELGWIDGSCAISQPLAAPPESLLRAERTGQLFGPAVTKLTLLNFATPAMVRALEWIGALAPELPHMFLTSSRDECVDKSLRILRWHRPEAQIAIGFEGGYLGHTTAAARSLSDAAVHAQGAPYFDWPLLPHPAQVGSEATCAALRKVIDSAGAGRIFGLYYEPVQERTGRVIPADFWNALAGLRSEFDLPVVAVETASACYRNGQTPFASPALGHDPDLLLWWGGAQTGYIHTSARYFVAKPLTMVSTWDGDELSLVRQHHELRALRKHDLAAAVAQLDRAAASLVEAGIACAGLGLYRVLDAGEHGDTFTAALRDQGVVLRRFANQRLALAPAVEQAEAVADALIRACAQ